MPQVAEDVALLIEQLSKRIAVLEARVSALEYPHTSSAEVRSGTAAAIDSSESGVAHPTVGESGNVVPVLGKAVLAMAGAYLLRAIAESGTIPQLAMLAAGIVYAGVWMTWAVRSHRTNHFASATYGITATLILAPLLYESTARFHLLSVAATSAVLVGFVVLVLLLAWHNNLQVLPWVATLASVATAWALIFSTHELVPLTVAFLTIAFATEVAACLGHRLSLWAMVAIAADAAVALFIYVMTMPDGAPSSYTQSSATTTTLISLSLLGIYGGGIATRSFGERKQIANFEVLQGITVFVLAYIGVTRASAGAAASILGSLFLVASLVSYWGVLSRFSIEGHVRNRSISGTWAVLLMLAAVGTIFSPDVGTILFCLLSVVTLLLYRRDAHVGLALHTSLYLVAAAILSPVTTYVRDAFAGLIPGAPHWTVWIVLASALICYVMAPYTREARWTRRVLWITSAVLASGTSAALIIAGTRALIAMRFVLAASHISGIRTGVTCGVALVLGFLASRYKRAELGWIAYIAVALGALKLLFEDLRFGNASSLVVSLLFYGLILILLPKLLKPSRSDLPANLQ